MQKIAIAFAISSLFVLACNKSESSAAPSASAATAPVTATAAPSAAAAAPSAAATVDPAVVAAVPVPEDFEDDAKKTVTADTLDTQLDQLEKSIASAPKK